MKKSLIAIIALVVALCSVLAFIMFTGYGSADYIKPKHKDEFRVVAHHAKGSNYSIQYDLMKDSMTYLDNQFIKGKLSGHETDVYIVAKDVEIGVMWLSIYPNDSSAKSKLSSDIKSLEKLIK